MSHAQGNPSNAGAASAIRLDDCRIASLPADAFYIPNFVTTEEETLVLSKINAPTSRWHSLTHRRLQSHPAPLTNCNILVTPPHLPDWLTTTPPILERFSKLGIFVNTLHKTANHVLINEYTPGQGIMPHEDGSAYAPVVATVSLGAGIVLDIYERMEDSLADASAAQRKREPRWRIFQEPRSLLITTGSMYTDYLHGIAGVDIDNDIAAYDMRNRKGVVNWDLVNDKAAISDSCNKRGTRVSLTYRDVLKAKELGKSLKLFTKDKR